MTSRTPHAIRLDLESTRAPQNCSEEWGLAYKALSKETQGPWGRPQIPKDGHGRKPFLWRTVSHRVGAFSLKGKTSYRQGSQRWDRQEKGTLNKIPQGNGHQTPPTPHPRLVGSRMSHQVEGKTLDPILLSQILCPPTLSRVPTAFPLSAQGPCLLTPRALLRPGVAFISSCVLPGPLARLVWTKRGAALCSDSVG